MSQLSETDRVRAQQPVVHTHTNTTTTTSEPRVPVQSIIGFSQEDLRRITGMIYLGFGILNGLIAIRFLLKLMAANPANPFASFIYTITYPFLFVFQGLTITPAFEGIEIEFFSLIAIAFYFLLGWVITRVIWLSFARLK
jgi:uncharacterized protein YggT (Ycf19 family)